MSSRHAIGQEAAVAQADEHGEIEVEPPELRPSVEQEVQATVDHADERRLNGRLFGQTLAAEERMRAREWEVERTRKRWDRGQGAERERRCQVAVEIASVERRRAFAERAASVDPWEEPDRPDARELLSRAELAAVNRAAARMSEKLDGFSTAAISRHVTRRVVDGLDVRDAALSTFEALQTAPGHVVPIGLISEVQRREVDLEGTVRVLWSPSHPKIAQVGLLEDETGRIKFTVWKKSRQPVVREGERVRFRSAARNWYGDRVSVALTGWSEVVRLGD